MAGSFACAMTYRSIPLSIVIIRLYPSNLQFPRWSSDHHSCQGDIVVFSVDWRIATGTVHLSLYLYCDHRHLRWLLRCITGPRARLATLGLGRANDLPEPPSLSLSLKLQYNVALGEEDKGWTVHSVSPPGDGFQVTPSLENRTAAIWLFRDETAHDHVGPNGQ
jgi:hypothetical protein